MKLLSIIVPTIGRDSLRATLASIASQWDGEQVIVIEDGYLGLASSTYDEFAYDFPAGAWCYLGHESMGGYGHGLRNFCLDEQVVEGQWLATIDDDDVYLPGAFAYLREWCCDSPVFFKMNFGPGSHAHGITTWQRQKLLLGEVGTPMILAPVCKARFGLYYDGDLVYAQSLVDEVGEPIWREEVIAEVRPVKQAVA